MVQLVVLKPAVARAPELAVSIETVTAFLLKVQPVGPAVPMMVATMPRLAVSMERVLERAGGRGLMVTLISVCEMGESWSSSPSWHSRNSSASQQRFTAFLVRLAGGEAKTVGE